MKRHKRLLTYLFLCFCYISTFAQTEDDNAIITKKEDVFTFKINDDEKLFIEEKSSATYVSPISKEVFLAEFYDDFSEITDIKVNGLKNVRPQYNMYQEEGLFYQDTKVCVINLPFTQKNKIAEVSYKRIYHDPHYFTQVYLSEQQFIQNKVVKFIIPYWMEIEIQEKNLGINIKKEVITDEKAKTNTYIYYIENQKTEKKEPNSPGYSYTSPHLRIVSKSATIGRSKQSIYDGLESLYKWNHGATLQDSSDSTIIHNKAQEIIKECTTPESRIKAIYSWVQENIRYIAFEYGVWRFRPDDAQNVLQKKYGDCKGMSNLLKSLLVAAGFDARLVWIATNKIDFDFSIPLPILNHMICALNWDNKLYFLDPTVKYMPLGEYTQSIQGRVAMIEDGDNYLIKRVPSISPTQNKDSLSCEYTVADNMLSGKAVNSFHGESKQVIMSHLHSTEKDKQDYTIKRLLEKGEVQDKVSNIIVTGTEPQSDNLSISYDIEHKSAIQAINDELYISLNSGKEYEYLAIDTTKRENDYLFPYKDQIVRQITLHIPQGYKVTELPSGLTIKNNNLLFTVSYVQKGNKIIYRKEITMVDPWVKRSCFKEWNDHISTIRKAHMEQITLKKL